MVENVKYVTQFDKVLYSEENHSRPFLEGLDWYVIPHEKGAFLETPFEHEEIKQAIWSMDKNRATSLMVLLLVFSESIGMSLKLIFLMVFKEFHRNGKIVVNIKSTFITLVPKKDRLVKVKDYMPVIHLSEVFGDTISKNRGAFVAGRQMSDASLIADEVVDEMRERLKQCLAFKLDFEKANDRVSCNILDKVLQRKGFSPRWRSWISCCLATKTFLVIVHREPKSRFHDERGEARRSFVPLSVHFSCGCS